MFLAFSLILNYDMYRLMKNPFKPPRMRVNSYFFCTGMVFLFIIFSEIFVFIARVWLNLDWIQLDRDGWDDPYRWIKSLELDLIYILYPPQLILNFIIILKICRQLSRKGMSPRLMPTILYRYVLVFLAILPQYISSTLYYLSRHEVFNLDQTQ